MRTVGIRCSGVLVRRISMTKNVMELEPCSADVLLAECAVKDKICGVGMSMTDLTYSTKLNVMDIICLDMH